jgi:rubrerythrin
MFNCGKVQQNYHQQIRDASTQAPIAFENQLRAMGFSFSDIMKMVQQINDDVMCGPECQRQKKLDELMGKLNKAKKTQEDAPYDLETAKKNYYTYKDGEAGYIQKMRSEYRKAAQQQMTEQRAEFDGKADTVEQQINQVEAQQLYIQNMNDLLQTYIKENKRLTKEIDDIKAILVTDNRRSFYLGQKWSWETYVVWALKAIYAVVIAIFVLYYVLYMGRYRNVKLLAISAVLVALPFVLNFLLTLRIMGHSIQSVLDSVTLPTMTDIDKNKRNF